MRTGPHTAQKIINLHPSQLYHPQIVSFTNKGIEVTPEVVVIGLGDERERWDGRLKIYLKQGKSLHKKTTLLNRICQQAQADLLIQSKFISWIWALIIMFRLALAGTASCSIPLRCWFFPWIYSLPLTQWVQTWKYSTKGRLSRHNDVISTFLWYWYIRKLPSCQECTFTWWRALTVIIMKAMLQHRKMLDYSLLSCHHVKHCATFEHKTMLWCRKETTEMTSNLYKVI